MIVGEGTNHDVLVENFIAQGDLNRRFSMATNSFLLTGGDGYRALKEAAEERGSEVSDVGERQVMIDYIDQILAGLVDIAEPPPQTRVARVIRFATFNTSLNRPNAGDLSAELATPDSSQAKAIAEIIQRVNPDVVTIQEFDYDQEGVALTRFVDNYLKQEQVPGVAPVDYPFQYAVPSNTGRPSGLDFNNDGIIGGGNDAYGFGLHEGQFGFAILSKFAIDTAAIRSFQSFLWKDMPDALLPPDPADADGNGDRNHWFTTEELNAFRLSSKNHIDIPIRVPGRNVHFLVSHPTPPVFDGIEDLNGRRNHDEIRLWADYITPGAADYLVDDNGLAGG